MSAKESKPNQDPAKSDELSEDDLETVAGGFMAKSQSSRAKPEVLKMPVGKPKQEMDVVIKKEKKPYGK